MRVLHLVKTVHGAAWALRQIEILCQLGIDVVVALPSAEGGLAHRYAAAGARVEVADLDFTAGQPWRLAGALRRCRALVARVQPDLIHSHFVSTTLVARRALGRAHPIPRVFQVPGPLHLEHPLFRRLDLATSGPRDAWIASCRWTYDAYLRCGVDRERVSLSYYGTDLASLRAGRPGTLRRELGVGAGVPLVGMVAHLYGPKRFLGHRRGIKGHEDFIAAFGQLLQAAPATRAVVVGGTWRGAAPYERRLREYARRICGDALDFTGTRSDIPAVYADLDVAVHPSLSENCGGAVESLAAGCPTIATAVGGLPDVVIEGTTGWLVPPGDPTTLAAAITAALGDRLEALRRARAGQQHVGKLFDIERTGREIASIYTRILGREAERSAARPATRVTAATAGEGNAVYAALKRIIDVGGALVLLLVGVPLLVLAALAVRLTLGAPVLYRQTRSGRNGRSFTLLKLRTMRLVRDINDVTSDDTRLTPLGRWLRATSLDEIPQLWNVLRGDMSLVGPRPLLPEYLGRYSAEQARRHEALPGITGLAQVSGRNGLSWEEKFRLDVWYVDHQSLGLDLWIMWRTVVALVRGDAITAPGHASMPEFRGSGASRRGARKCATS